MPDDAGPAGAESGPDPELFLPRHPARQKQICHIRAGDEQNEAHGAKQDEQGLLNLTAELRSQWNEVDARVRIEFGIGFFQPRRDRVHLGLGLRQRDAWFEARDSHRETAVTLTQFT